ncbi:DUF5658 family protein [Thalassoglobus sp.]|uniref:DUF5658 family protein n=1 Tax=Thalassoglobus sp. TaxID=2795869 RepID=UPI003AA86E15
MTNQSEEDRKQASPGNLKRLLLRQLPLEAETSMFILVNMIDFFMTYWLLQADLVRESNPIANYFLAHWGPIKGMLYFKLGLVVVVCLIVQVVALKDLKKAAWVLNFGTVVVSGVVIYSLILYLRASGIV